MPPRVTKKAEPKEITLTAVERGQFQACILGMTPFIHNCVSEKAKRELLFPSGRKTAAQKQAHLKHYPIEEYRASPYRDTSSDGPTAMQIVAASFKKAMASIPLDLPDTGTNKSQLSRLVFAPADRVPIYGIPQLMMSVVRDANGVPDVRTRAITPQWACRVDFTYVMPVLRHEVVVKLLSCAGFMRGVGDWRPEKGSGSFGCFEVVSPDDQRFLHIIEHGVRAAQLEALEAPTFYDDESERMFSWFNEELVRRNYPKGGNGVGTMVDMPPDAVDDSEDDTDAVVS